MSNTFLVSDTHFGHIGVTQFLRADGTKVRPWDNIQDMDEALVDNWNSVVRPQDKVIHLGDVVINRKHLPTVGRLNGIKILVKGNHDVFRLEEFSPYFKDICGAKEYDKAILTHIPVHPQQLGRYKYNIHGHLHTEVVMREWRHHDDVWYEEDERYRCVSVEQINYTPIAWEVLKKEMEERNA